MPSRLGDGVAAIGSRFSVSGFWDEVRAFDATVLNFMGAMITLIWKQPPAPTDRDHRVRLGWGVPMPTWEQEWVERFGFRLYEVYGLTDAGVPCYDPIDRPRRRPIADLSAAVSAESPVREQRDHHAIVRATSRVRQGAEHTRS